MIKEDDYKRIIAKVRKIKINTKFDVPYFAGYNWAGNKIYVGKGIQKTIKIDKKRINLHFSLAVHECAEKQLMNKGYTYAGAHNIANQYEKKYVQSKGIKWDDYDKKVGKLMRKNFLSGNNKIPIDLDLTPYIYSNEKDILKKMRKYIKKVKK